MYPVGMVKLSPAANAPVHRGWIPGEHRGEDRNASGGFGIRASAPGVVEEVYADGGWNGGWGNRMVVRVTPRATITVNHWESGSQLVGVGDYVGDQQDLCTMGLTGDTTGYHVHFELYIDGVRVDPAPYYSQDLPGSDGSGSGGVPAPSGWVVGTTDFQGQTGVFDVDGAKWYVVPPVINASDTIAAVTAAHGTSLQNAKHLTDLLANSRWAGSVLQSGSSWWDGSDNYYAGQIVALNDVAGIFDAKDAAELAAQQAAVAASIVPVPAVASPEVTNKGLFLPPEPKAPVEEAAKPVLTREPERRSYTADELAAVVSAALSSFHQGQETAPEPDKPVIADKVAKPLWVIFAAIGVSAGPIAQFAVLLWGADIDTATQLSVTVTGWTGSLAAVLGLSRFAKSK